MKDIFLGLLAESLQLQQTIFPAGLLKRLDGFDLELVIKDPDPFRPEARDVKQLEDPGRDGFPKLFVIRKPALLNELVDLFGKPGTDALQRLQLSRLEERFEILRLAFKDTGGVVVGPDFKRIVTLEFEKDPDLLENLNDGLLRNHRSNYIQFPLAFAGENPENPILMMKAVFFRQHGGLDILESGYQPEPTPGPGEVLLRVKACALNHLDLWTRQGMPGIKIPLPHILGCDVAGEVAKLGHGVRGAKEGQRVVVAPGISCGRCRFCRQGWDSLCDDYKILGLQTNGGYAEYVKVPARNLISVSKKLTFEEWASIPLVFLTAWHMLHTRAQLKKGETVLIHAAGSGVGSAALQIAKYLGARVFTTVGSPEKIRPAKALGADEVINYREKDFVAEVKRLTKNRGVDVVFEHIGPETFSKSLAALSKKGRVVTCGVTSGPLVNLDLRFVFVRQLSIFGSYMGGFKEFQRVIRRVERGRFKAVVDKVFPLKEAREAQARMLERKNFGKIVLVP